MPICRRAAVFVMMLAAAPAAAAQTTARTPAEVAERIDHYRFAPRAPGTYRALAGMGDPDRAPDGPNDPVTPAQRALLARMLPGQQSIHEEYWYPWPGVCRTDYALSVAEARVAQLGMQHPYVDQWLRTQRTVFSACQRDERWRADQNPAPAPTALPPAMATQDAEIARLQRDDRAYQAAALLFYRGDARARPAFAAIARSSSRHSRIARYMLAALHLSEEDFFGSEEDPARTTARGHQALVEAQAILADPRLADVHPLAQGLIGFLGYHMADERTRRAQVRATLDALEAPLARIAADPVAADRYARARSDVGSLHRRLEDEAWWLTGAVPRDAHASRAMADEARSRPLAAFLLFPVSHYERAPWADEGPRNHDSWAALASYAEQQTRREPGEAWAVIHSTLADHYEPEAWAQLDARIAAARADPTDRRLAALGTLFYHQVRRALTQYFDSEPRGREARHQGFREALTRVEAWPWRESGHHRELVSDMLQYLIVRGRIAEARLLRDRVNPRGELYHGATTPMLLLLAENDDQLVREIAASPDHGHELLNLLSSAALPRLAAREELPALVRARFARVAWSRLYALQRRVPEQLDRLMRQLNPEVTAAWRSRPGARPDNRPLLLDVLRSPALNIIIAGHQRLPTTVAQAAEGAAGLTSIDTYEHSDNNWWCAWQPQRHALNTAAAMYDSLFARSSERWRDRDPLAVAGAPAALGPLLQSSRLWQLRDVAELEALAGIPSAPQLLAERALSWRGSGSREGQDEALALAVRATRYGCQRQGGHAAWSRPAHALLHQRFPGSEAARRTRWWFDCSHFTGGCPGPEGSDLQAWRRWTRRIYWSDPDR